MPLLITETIDIIQDSVPGVKVSLELEQSPIGIGVTVMEWRVSYEGHSAMDTIPCGNINDEELYKKLLKLIDNVMERNQDGNQD